MASHLAVISSAKGQPFQLETRPTPKPGPNELLIAVKSVALNPADAIMRDQGLFIPTYPTVLGFDMSGLVLEVGDNVPTDTNLALSFQPGITRVAAFAALFWRSCDPDYGPFQERCLVPWQHAIPLPDESISWNHAATLPVAVEVAHNAWEIMGISRMGQTTAFDPVSAGRTSEDVNNTEQKSNVRKREALLIWGGLLKRRHYGPVYATAGSANQSYICSLGADRVFDYKDPQVVNEIVSAANEDGLVIRHCFLATGQLEQGQAVLKAFLEKDHKGKVKTAKIGSAPVIPADAEVVDGVETIFVMPSAVEEERLEQFRYWIGTWLRENLDKGTIRPSPEPIVIGKGLEAINAGLDKLLLGVSCTKLVVEVAE
ncbi:uncharacterized protein N7477_001055 [Penicillium maclennaniae]|uniref:uncharacterized protein n=1 Tax=Penicillium maclennaniae TaxID=1343394 RepID=UPI0025425A9E|nr:uncharacterized protein N7477_001055 [Penicillium maclennaniae]KAJ5684710.1 hypothetical protein N7477_001055 [Penicillium maclennaniae]